MKQTLNMVRDVQDKYSETKNKPIPVIIAGDIFDHWKAPPELINFAIQNLPPNIWAIPGQHDLPLHNYADIRKSAYWTLVEAKKINDIQATTSQVIPNTDIAVYGFPWGTTVRDRNPKLHKSDKNDASIHIAVIHAYIWAGKHKYTGAPAPYKLDHWLKKLGNYTIAAFGDNHKGFTWRPDNLNDGPTIMNCGTMLRRKIDEKGYEPRIGLVHEKGGVTDHVLVTNDKFIDVDEALEIIEKALDMTEFMGELAKLGDSGIKFYEAVKNFLKENGIDERIKKIVLQSLERKS